MVYDLGGGTLDVALLSLEDGVFRVEYTTGDYLYRQPHYPGEWHGR